MHTWWLLPLSGAFTGWLMAVLWIQLVFRVMLPKRKKALDSRLSKVIATQFFSMREIEEKLVSYESFQKLLPSIEGHIDEFLQHKLGKAMPFLGMFIGDKTIRQLKELFMEELAELFPAVMKNYVSGLQRETSLEAMVHSKLSAISSRDIELAIRQNFNRELRMFSISGVVTGLLIGIVHAVLLLFIS